MKKGAKKKSVKSVYEKPQLHIIELAAEEVLSVGCKMTGGPTNVSHASCGLFNNCVSQGS
jgi:hypothetical protein